MAERADPHHVADRLVCPNCPADYPTPFSKRYISCRRCGTEFLAPDEARDEDDGTEPDPESGHEPIRRTDGGGAERVDGRESARRIDRRLDRGTVEGDGDRIGRSLRAIRRSAPVIALAFNVAALSLWGLGLASFEIAVLTVLLVMNGVAVQDRL
ncbi:hypothetical protein [Natronococcus occultus]|uniref:Uncharacterized protein n=1 Tax=Natronococcus occultus SP4 TaxID=694430 RepID=L0JWG6_9EURY|nr:hypothetical protein [Natronococcus occultus]AGB36444.1 hypothetical protein Natoc_0583 [Natronococcus occultus SP4]